LSVPGGGYSRNTSSVLTYISTFPEEKSEDTKGGHQKP